MKRQRAARRRRKAKAKETASRHEFAIRLTSIDQLFWEFDARPIAEREISADARWAMLDEWDRVRELEPSTLVIYAPASDRAATDEDAISRAIHSGLDSASGPLKRVDPLSRQEKISLRLGLVFWFASILFSTGIDRSSQDVLAEGISQGIVVVGWVALWPPAARFMTEVVPHFFNRRRFAEFADIAVRFVWV
ncbi:MAG TPA: hypothetical protein VNC17_16535 [Thermoleophilaceae bacterium]|jgi:hypothetical protein|nr:hypothetical protein [Thermoleophilaceae bacterium]